MHRCVCQIIDTFQFVQVTIIIVLFRMRASGYLYEIFIGNICLPLQFFARGYQIYHFHKQFQMLGKWAKSVFYFLMYIMAGHVSLSLHCHNLIFIIKVLIYKGKLKGVFTRQSTIAIFFSILQQK